MTPLSRPDIGAAEKKAVLQVLESPTLSLGSKLSEFEVRLARQAKRKYAVGVNSGTSGLHLIIRALGIGKGDEVITTPFSFIASANCMLYEGAKPVFVDINEETFNIDVSQIEKKITKKTKAILAVDVFGYPADWKELRILAKKKNLKLIEDSAEAVGSMYHGEPCGSFGDASIYSFYPNKQMTSVRYQTPVLIKKNGITQLVKIGKLMDFMIDEYWEPEGYQCLAFDKQGRISWQNIDAFIKHDAHSEILKIHLEKGREVEITKSHSVFTVRNSQVREVLGRNLKVGDHLIVPRKLPAPEKFTKEIDVLDYTSRRNIKYNSEKIIVENNQIGGGGGKYIGRKIKIDKRFCKLLGYFAAEGGYEGDESGGGLRFTFGFHERKTYVKEVKDIFEGFWPNFKVSVMPQKKMNKCSISAGGLIHSDLFRNLGCGENVYKKSIPHIIWDTTNENKLAFIEGLLEGDGHYRVVNGSESRKLKVASENLANGLHYLLLTLGIQSRLERQKFYSKKGKLCYAYSCEILGFDEQTTARENCIPTEFLSLTKGSLQSQKGRFRDKKSISVETLKKWVREKQVYCPSFLLEDIALLQIKRIGKEKFHEFVYDFEVKGKENFVGGYGAICLHNTGEGGAVLTDDKRLADLANSMRNQGRKVEGGKWLEHVRLGYNYRLPEIECALGIEQLKRLPEILRKRARAASLYGKKLKDIPGIEPALSGAKGITKSWFVYVALLSKNYTRKQRDKLVSLMAKQGIQCSTYFQTIHLQPFYREMFGFREGSFPIAESVSDRTIALPFFSNITEQQIERVVRGLRASLQKVS